MTTRAKIVFLRGAVPPANENPDKLLYDKIEECEDVWTQLFHALLARTGSVGELLYQGKSRTFKVDDSFTEKWVPSMAGYSPSFKPDIVIARGGFGYYDGFLSKYPKAKRVYYGAGERYAPEKNFKFYDLFLTDAPKHRKKIRARGGNAEFFVKPAARLFAPMPVEKKYDVCFMANATQSKIKRHKLVIESFKKTGLKVLNIGNTDKTLIRYAKSIGADVEWEGWKFRKFLPELISSCRVGLCCSTGIDSCPRVIPEYLACGLPVVVTNSVKMWRDKYITDSTGLSVGDDKIVSAVKRLLSADSTRSYYEDNLSVDSAADYLAGLLQL